MLFERRFILDYLERIFLQTSFNNIENSAFFINVYYPIDPFVPNELYPPLLQHGPSGQIPVAVHFNGRADKHLMDDWWGKLWWSKFEGPDGRFREIVSKRLEGAAVNFAGGGGRKPLTEICPGEFYSTELKTTWPVFD